MNEPRKASDILIDLEEKINKVLAIQQIVDTNVKNLSNKLNEITTAINNGTQQKSHKPPEFSIEAPKTISISQENQLPIEQAPVGFRRTSRPETFEQQNTQ